MISEEVQIMTALDFVIGEIRVLSYNLAVLQELRADFWAGGQ